MKYYLFALGLIFLNKSYSSELIVSENLLLSVPGLPLTGAYPLSWGIIRSQLYWDGNQTLDFSNLNWPTWDTQQVPIALVPANKQKTTLFVYDSQKLLIEKIEIDKPFFPQTYKAKTERIPKFFQIQLSLIKGKIEVLSELYPWYENKRIAVCEADFKKNIKLENQQQIKVCFKTIEAYLAESNTDKRNLYLKINWPKIKTKEDQTVLKSIDRDFKKLARIKKNIYLSERTTKSNFDAEIGLTQIENLPRINFYYELIEDQNLVSTTPSNQKAQTLIKKITLKDNAEVNIYGFYNDIYKDRVFDSPILKKNKINLQIFQADNDSLPLEYQSTLQREQRTGLLGQLRHWQFFSILGYNFLSSSKGENIQFLSFPSFEARLTKTFFDIDPYIYFNKDMFQSGSKLQITELKVGATKKFETSQKFFYSLGYLQYALAGENTGASRLGELKSVMVGIGAIQKFESWRLKEEINLFLNSEPTFDYRLNVGRLISNNTDESFYLGGFAAYSTYQASVFNKLNNKELLGENRFQIGLKIGWLGADSF